jgi:integrase
VKEWLSESTGLSVQRKRAQAVRAFGRWCEEAGLEKFAWWKKVPLPTEPIRPQVTVSETVYKRVLKSCRTKQDRALIEVLWSTGLRRGEIERLRVEHIDFANGYVVVESSKSGKPRVVPISPIALRAVRRVVGSRSTGSALGLSGNAIRLRLRRLDAPSAHAWRRGWAVQAMRSGISESSLKSAAGWSSGEMVSRYTLAQTGEIAIGEFRKSWERLVSTQIDRTF